MTVVDDVFLGTVCKEVATRVLGSVTMLGIKTLAQKTPFFRSTNEDIEKHGVTEVFFRTPERSGLAVGMIVSRGVVDLNAVAMHMGLGHGAMLDLRMYDGLFSPLAFQNCSVADLCQASGCGGSEQDPFVLQIGVPPLLRRRSL